MGAPVKRRGVVRSREPVRMLAASITIAGSGGQCRLMAVRRSKMRRVERTRQGALWSLTLALLAVLLSATGCGRGADRPAPADHSTPEKPVPSKKEAGRQPSKPFETIKPH
jgi:hypothetical protein